MFDREQKEARRRQGRAELAVAVAISLFVMHPAFLGFSTLFWQGEGELPRDLPIDLEMVPIEPTKQPLLTRTQKRKQRQKQRRKNKQQREKFRRLKMVEVPNLARKEPPPAARYLSDKHRWVEKETRARHTSLVMQSARPKPLSKPNPQQLKKPGAAQRKVAQKRERQTARQRRAAQDRGQPLLHMRGDGQLKLRLTQSDYERVFPQRAAAERQLASAQVSRPRGKTEAKWQRIQTALENFVPEVQPGDQTALRTRAEPFALYIAQMHRRIHELWGFGFLQQLSFKSARNALNDIRLWASIEIAIAPNGQVTRAMIVKPSGVLPFDVAALDTVFSASPYPPTPVAIRSADDNVYMHWRFHRDRRQCGTFGVEPYILDKAPDGPIDSDHDEVGKLSSLSLGPQQIAYD